MLLKTVLPIALTFGFAVHAAAQEKPKAKPSELAVLKQSIGVWDAEIEVWAQGPDSDTVKFKGIETTRAYGEHWVASDFDSEIGGQTMKVHSIIGYDLDKGKLVGTVIDHGPYSASMVGDYDKESKTVTWMTKAKDVDGKQIIQKTLMTQTSADERLLVLMVPGPEKDQFNKFMQIKYTKRQ